MPLYAISNCSIEDDNELYVYKASSEAKALEQVTWLSDGDDVFIYTLDAAPSRWKATVRRGFDFKKVK
jgi:hypothetical protein